VKTDIHLLKIYFPYQNSNEHNYLKSSSIFILSNGKDKGKNGIGKAQWSNLRPKCSGSESSATSIAENPSLGAVTVDSQVATPVQLPVNQAYGHLLLLE